MRILILGFAAGIALAPLSAMAADATPEVQPQAQPVSTTPSPNMVVCHYFYSRGTVIPHQDCHPLRYWAWRRHETQEGLREFQTRALAEKS